MSEPVPESEALRATLQDILRQLASLSERLTAVEKLVSMAAPQPAPAAAAGVESSAPAAAPAQPAVAAEAEISEEELLAISAAVAAWLGVQAHIRQVRLIRTGAWAQQGRVTIQASHRLY